ncbi:MAG: hypothetical protein IT380_07345 [Myxococcales bacterium]|nr:hypothetical protein [Myxococcales bacterium]
MFRFYAVPSWQALGADPKKSQGEPADPLSPKLDAPMERILDTAEYRGERALARAQRLVAEAKGPAVYARPPKDLPALLRTADQLLLFTHREAGERALVWRCECGTRFAVPVTLLRPVTIRCERCGRMVDLDPARSAGVSHLTGPELAQINSSRQALADFFREAMARGWPVMVARS